MLDQINFSGLNKVEVAISRLQAYEPSEGYYLAFSGGKDSVVIKALADMAGVKYDAHYSITTVDPPDLIYFVREHHADVEFEKPEITMWRLIPKCKVPPTRKIRYCCDHLKETGGVGRFVVTGVRWAESSKRKNNRAGLELNSRKGKHLLDDPDNPANELMARTCPTKGKHILNPIIDWDDEEVWEFIHRYNVPYCKLYDEGFKRLGCIGCPLSSHQKEELERYPKIKQAYLRAFKRMLENRTGGGTKEDWKTPEEVMEWWINQ
jgi:phosphoadenosine phosphosulfate reductase